MKRHRCHASATSNWTTAGGLPAFSLTVLLFHLPSALTPHVSSFLVFRCLCAVGRDNKNKFLMAWAGWLVSRGVFDIMELQFLPVGHTHEVHLG